MFPALHLLLSINMEKEFLIYDLIIIIFIIYSTIHILQHFLDKKGHMFYCFFNCIPNDCMIATLFIIKHIIKRSDYGKTERNIFI